jgi:acetolactate synthase-1/2/3 large subunit
MDLTTGENSTIMSAGDSVVRMLQYHGVKHIFGVCGDTSLPFYDSMNKLDHGIEHILARDERCAAYMADVYARLTDRVGVVEGPSGAGATYMVPGIAEANGTTIPVLAITSDIPITGRDTFVLTECDQEALFKPFTKYTRVVENAESIPTAFRAAFNAMTTGAPGCAHIGLPYDVLKGTVTAEKVWADETLGSYPSRPQIPADQFLFKAKELILKSKKPVIITGGGTLHAKACDDLILLAESINAPVGTTISAKGTIAETHDLALGTIGTNGSSHTSRDIIRESDLLIYVGCRVGSVTSEKGTNPKNGEKTIIHIDIDPTSIGANYKTDVGLVGDAKLILQDLYSKVINSDDYEYISESWGKDAVLRAKLQKKDRFEEFAHSDESPIRPERIVTELQKALPDDVIVVSDPGTPTPFLCAYFETQNSGRSFIFHRFHGGLGFSLPGVIGAHYADTGRKIVGIMGDGSFGFSVGELETIVRLNIPVTLIVLNNSTFGWIKAGQDRSFGKRYYNVDFSSTNHAEVAKAYGLWSKQVSEPEQLNQVLEEALKHDGPSLVEIMTLPLHDMQVPVTAFLG